MCGITGFINFNADLATDELLNIIHAMTQSLTHRGPDGFDVWADPKSGIALGHRRLAVIDTTECGRQPMHSHNDRYVITYNGEIYNFLDLQKQLAGLGHQFKGHSDTEVLLAAIQTWGLDQTLSMLNGMFAFALWDKQERTLHLVRDRLGQKPLYYAQFGKIIIFGSELKSLRVHPRFKSNINRDALATYVRLSYIPDPQSIYQKTFKLSPGCKLSLNESNLNSPNPAKYWDIQKIATQARPESIHPIETLLADAVQRRMISDVPLGAFLSGGIDSSLIVALMQQQSTKPVRTFTIGFTEQAYNEAGYAAKVAAHLGTNHHELYITPETAQAVIPQLPQLYDEPFADISQIPTFLVAQLARQHVTVALSGDGGDEFFAGYNRHTWLPKLWRTIQFIPRPIRQCLAALQPSTSFIKNSAIRLKLQKLLGLLVAKNPADMYLRIISSLQDADRLVLHSADCLPATIEKYMQCSPLSFRQQMQLLDTLYYLPGDILTKVDRATMGVSLEGRSPFLDYRVVEAAWRLPTDTLVRGQQGKQILREMLYRYVPRELIERPKMGFGVPIGEWLRGSLQEWAQDLLSPAVLQREGYWDVQRITRLWQMHLRGQGDYASILWSVLMFQQWLHSARME